MDDIGYLGPPGTYCEVAVMRLIQNRRSRIQDFTTIEAAITAADSGKTSSCVVPIENSLEGSVAVTLDMLAHDTDLLIQREISCSIRHHLLVKDRLVRPQIIVSHPQALAQCRRTLAAKFPGIEVRPMPSTAAAAVLASQTEGCAAIASLRASELYHLEVAAADVQDNPCNFTRFVELSHAKGEEVPGPAKTSVVCQINGEHPGTLCELLEEFRRRQVNLTRIESRPARTRMGEYIFFLDIDGRMTDATVADAVEAVRSGSLWFKSFGTYPVL